MTSEVWIVQHDESPDNTILGVFASLREADEYADEVKDGFETGVLVVHLPVPYRHRDGAARKPRIEYSTDAVLFDMDGTLVDSTGVVEAAWGLFADRFGLQLADILAFSHGRQTLDTVRRFAPAGTDPNAVAAELQAWELVHTDGIVEVPGAAALLRGLRGARVAVVTSAPRELAVRRLQAAGVDVPPVLIAAEDVAAGKPDPAGYLLAAQRLGAEPARCIAFEDATAGIQAAVASGATTVVVGPADSVVAPALAHIPDFRRVNSAVGADGTIRLSWPRAAG